MKAGRHLDALLLATLLLQVPASLLAEVARFSLDGLVRESELIVEGEVADQEAINLDRRIDPYQQFMLELLIAHDQNRIDREELNRRLRAGLPSSHSVKRAGFHYQVESHVRVQVVHKGPVCPGDVISVLSHNNFVCNTSVLDKGGYYLLFLKRREDAWYDVGSGQGTLRITDSGGKLTAANSIHQKGPPTSMDELVHRVSQAMQAPGSQPASPGLSADDARQLANQLLTEAGVDLAKYEETGTEFLTLEADLEGVAFKGDPVWRVEWKAMGSADPDSRPADASVGAWVHARTARTRLFPDRLRRKRLTVEDGCRQFLSTDLMLGRTYAQYVDSAKVTRLDKAAFDRLRHRSVRTSRTRVHELNVPERPGSYYVRVDFEGRPDVEPLLMILSPTLITTYAGPVDIPATKPADAPPE